jgi:hypothetical protein
MFYDNIVDLTATQGNNVRDFSVGTQTSADDS